MGWTTLIFAVLTFLSACLIAYTRLDVRVAEDNWNVVGATILTAILGVITLILFIIYVVQK